MNENAEALLRELAGELGVTVEHLWSVLIRQAAIDGILTIIGVTLWIALVIVGYKYIIKKTTSTPPEWDGEGPIVAWLIWSATAIIILVIGTIELGDAFVALINPEYWALKEILGNIK